LLPNLECIGHAVQVEAPEKIIAALRPWLEQQIAKAD
jgi:hypothetical protein